MAEAIMLKKSGGEAIININQNHYAFGFMFQNAVFGAPTVINYVNTYTNTARTLDCNSAFKGATNLRKLNIQSQYIGITVPSMLQNTQSIEEVIFQAPTIENATYLFYNSTNLKTVTGFRCDSATNLSSAFYMCSSLENLECIPNSIQATIIRFDQCIKLTDVSLVSIANGMNSATSGRYKFASNIAQRLAVIMGTVTDGVFTADASGSVTLQDFITNTKGWTES